MTPTSETFTEEQLASALETALADTDLVAEHVEVDEGVVDVILDAACWRDGPYGNYDDLSFGWRGSWSNNVLSSNLRPWTLVAGSDRDGPDKRTTHVTDIDGGANPAIDEAADIVYAVAELVLPEHTQLVITDITPTHPQGFGRHEFDLDPSADLFKCIHCGGYEVALRDDTGSIQPCPSASKTTEGQQQ